MLTLYRSRLSFGAVVLLTSSALVAIVAALLVSDAGGALLGVAARRLGVGRGDGAGLAAVISLRYHVVSLAAVFLALALGVVLGSAGLSDPLLGAVSGQRDDLAGQVSQLTAERDAPGGRRAVRRRVRRRDRPARGARPAHRTARSC